MKKSDKVNLVSFIDVHHEGFFHILEGKVLTRYQQCDRYAEMTRYSEWEPPLKQTQFIYKNPYALELRWDDGNETITTVLILKNKVKIWPTILGEK